MQELKISRNCLADKTGAGSKPALSIPRSLSVSLLKTLASLALILSVTSCASPPPPTQAPVLPGPVLTDAPLPTLPVSYIPSCFPSDVLHPSQDSMGDPYYPQLGAGGYDATHYTLDLNVSSDFNLDESRATIEATATQDLTAFNFDLSGLDVKSVTVNGKAAKFVRNGIELAITPPEKLLKDSSFETMITYSGDPKPLDVGGGMMMGWNKYPGGSYVASEPAGAFTWYPVNDHPCDKATYAMNVSVAKPYVVAANGTLKNVTDNGATRTYSWEENYPVASYLVTVDVGKYVEQTGKSPNGVPIRSYFDEGIQNKADYFNRTGEQIAFFSSIFGPYPFDAYGEIVIDAPIGFALETQTLSLFGRARTTDPVYTEMVAAHELAHQWFGDSVSLKSWKDIWLNEGFATFAQWLWLDHRFGHFQYVSNASDYYNGLKRANLPPPGDPGSGGDQLFGRNVYYRGALTLYALRLQVGDDNFFEILREWAGTYAYGNASTADFIALSEKISGQNLQSFFQGWLYDKEMPPFPGTSSSSSSPSPSVTATP